VAVLYERKDYTMPRLDNGDLEVRRWFGLDYDEKDPGKTPPVDVCTDCGYGDLATVEHPPYGEQDPPYVCADCGTPLDDYDN